MQVTPNTFIRVKAVNKGVYVGQDSDIIVCDPDGHEPNARYPRIKAKDAKAGVIGGYISLDVDKKEFDKSEKLGDTNAAKALETERQVMETDLTALAQLEASISGEKLPSDIIARPVTAADLVDVSGAVVVPAAAGADASNATPVEIGVAMKHIAGGNYEVTAPWLAEPIKVKGKEAAEAEVARLNDEGAPPSE